MVTCAATPSSPCPGQSRGRMACRYRPRQACATHRWPPSGGFQCSLLSKDKLSNRLFFYEFTPRSISQKRLRKILGPSCSTLRRSTVTVRELCSLKSYKAWIQSKAIAAQTHGFSVTSACQSSWRRHLAAIRGAWPLNYVLWCHHK